MLLSEHTNETLTSFFVSSNKFLSDAMSAPAFLGPLRLKCQGLGSCRRSSLQTRIKAVGAPGHQLGGLELAASCCLLCPQLMGTPSPCCDGLLGSPTGFCLGSRVSLLLRRSEGKLHF